MYVAGHYDKAPYSVSDSWSSRMLFKSLEHEHVPRTSSQIDLMFTFLMLLFLVSFFYNVAVFLSLVVCHQKRAIARSAFDVYFISLTFANMMLLIPMASSLNMVELNETEVINVGCRIICCLDYLLQIVIISHLSVIAYDRFKSNNADYRQKGSKRLAVFAAIGTCWMAGIVFAIFNGLSIKKTEYSYSQTTCIVVEFRPEGMPISLAVQLLLTLTCLFVMLGFSVGLVRAVRNFKDLLHFYPIVSAPRLLAPVIQMGTLRAVASDNNADEAPASENQLRARNSVRRESEAREESSQSSGSLDQVGASAAAGRDEAPSGNQPADLSIQVESQAEEREQGPPLVLPPPPPPSQPQRTRNVRSQPFPVTSVHLRQESYKILYITLGLVLCFTTTCFGMQVWFNMRYLFDFNPKPDFAFTCRVLFYCMALVNPIHYTVYRGRYFKPHPMCNCWWCHRVRTSCSNVRLFCSDLCSRL